MLILPLVATALLTQGIRARFQDVPDLTLGQKVRVHFIAPAPPQALAIPLHGPKLGEGKIAGALSAYQPYELIGVRRNGWIAGLGPTDELTFDWADVTRIETAQPRNALNVVYGATGGLFGAMIMSAITMYVVRPFCDAPDGVENDCPGFWSTAGKVAVYAVPLGAVVGFFSTRWKPVYLRH